MAIETFDMYENFLEKNMKRSVAKTVGALGLAGCAVMNSPSAVADDTGWYAGANVGQSRAKIDDARITSQLLGTGFSTATITDNKRDTGYKIFGGYQFNPNFALEGGYFNLGRFGYTATTVPAGTLNGTIRLQGVNLDAVGILPMTEKFSMFGRAGLDYAQARDNFTGTGLVSVLNPNPSKNQLNYKLGLGLQYAFTESLGLRLETERYRINDAVGNHGDIDLVSLGLVYRFGKESPPPQPAAAPEPPPEPVAAAPEPAPVVAPPPPQPVLIEKVTFSADSLYDFGKATIRPSGKRQLDRFAKDLRSANFKVIRVTGHTDRIGTHAYNMRLSTRRAETVKTYLVESAGIPAGKIVAKGVDGSNPVTKPGQCPAGMATKKLIACLQPDRRVEVEVFATRPSE